jgi:hypothetical protein
VALRLDKAPFIDGPDGLFVGLEGERAIHPSIRDVCSFGAGQVALSDGVLVLLSGSAWPPTRPIVVRLDVLAEDDEWTDNVVVDAVDSPSEVLALEGPIVRKIESALDTGAVLVGRLSELCPHVILGDRAIEQLSSLFGSEPYFPQVMRHLRALDRAAQDWTPNTPFKPEGVTFSVESEATLKHGSYGPLRDFPTPLGFQAGRWTLHTKLTGGSGARIYYKTSEIEDMSADAVSTRRLRVAVGYLGPHLPTVKFC